MTERGLRRTRFRSRRCRARTISSPEVGNVYSVGHQLREHAGRLRRAAAVSASIKPEALEQSNVDLASELTSMIKSQRGYTANSKVFQTGADLLDVLVNLKR